MFRSFVGFVIGAFRGIGRFWLVVERSHQHIVPVTLAVLQVTAWT